MRIKVAIRSDRCRAHVLDQPDLRIIFARYPVGEFFDCRVHQLDHEHEENGGDQCQPLPGIHRDEKCERGRASNRSRVIRRLGVERRLRGWALNEGQVVEYEVVANRGKEAAEKLKVK